MKQVTQSSLGFDINFQRPENLAELAELLGVSEEEALQIAIDGLTDHYKVHNWLVKFRSNITEKLAEQTGVARKGDTVDGKFVPTETEKQHFDRCIAYIEDQGESQEDYSSMAQEVANAIPFDYKSSPRGSGKGSKPAAKWIETLKDAINSGKLESLQERFGIELEPTEEPSEETGMLYTDESVFSLANAIKVAVIEAQKAASRQALGSL